MVSSTPSHWEIVGTLTPSGQLSLVQDLSVPAGHQREKTAKGGEVFHRGHGANITLQVGLQIRTEPESRPARTCECFRIATPQQRHLGGLADRKGQELQYRRAARHGLGDPLHQRCFLRASEQPLPDAARLAVNARADMCKHFGRVLHLVEDRGCRQFVEEALGIGPKPRHHVGILEQKVAGLGKQPTQQQRLARAPWPGEHHGGKVAGRLRYLPFQSPRDVFHE